MADGGCEGNKELPDKIIAPIYAPRRKHYAVADFKNILLAVGVSKDGEVRPAEIITYGVPVRVEFAVEFYEAPYLSYRVLWRDRTFGRQWFEGDFDEVYLAISRHMPT